MDVVTILACAAAAVVSSWQAWWADPAEGPGGHQGLLETGEERTRFVALCGILSGLDFLCATVFDGLGLFLVSLCGA